MASKSRIKIPVYLLKTRSTPTDAYETVLRQPHNRYTFEARFIPVLEHRLIEDSLEHLRKLVTQGSFLQTLSTNVNTGGPITTNSSPRDSSTNDSIANVVGDIYAGIIFTSQRAVDAFASVVESLRSASINIETLIPPQLTFYVVGPATSRAVQALGLPCRVAGAHTGNGDALAKFILEDLDPQSCPSTNPATSSANELTPVPSESSAGSRQQKLLFLVGETRRDIIPRTLTANSITVDEVTVYATVEADSFASEFASALQQDSHPSQTSTSTGSTASASRSHYQNISASSPRSSKWILVFSPQGSKAMLSTLGLLDSVTGKVKEGYQSCTDRAWQRIHSEGIAAMFGDSGFLSEEESSLLSEDGDDVPSNKKHSGNTGGESTQDSLRNTEGSSTNNAANTERSSDNLGENETEENPHMRKTYIATIGPTTQAYLAREFDFQVDVCAAKPTPEAVRQGIISYLDRM